MTLTYANSRDRDRTSLWAVCCGCAAMSCLLLATFAIVLAFLPIAWVGHPYLRLVELFHPGADSPDNWALNATYVIRFELVMIASAIALLLVGNPRFWFDWAREVFLARSTKAS
jgi:hypothetical protein